MLVRVVVPIAILLVSVLVVAGLLLSLLVRSDRVHEELNLRTSASVGARVGSNGVSLLWPPPSIRVHRPQVISAEGEPPPLEAESMDLRLRLAPLLRGRIAPSSIEIRRPVLRLLRDGRTGLAGAKAIHTAGATVEEEQAERSAPALALEDLRIHGGRILLGDSPSAPNGLLRIEGIEARLGPRSGEALAIHAGGELAEGGRFTADGQILNGRLELATLLDSIDVSRVGDLVADIDELSGRASGRVVVAGEPSRPDHLVVDLQLSDAVLRVKQVEMLGTVGLRAELAADLAWPGCRFVLDGTGAELSYGEAYHKASGVGAHVTGELTRAEDGSASVDNLHLKVGGNDAPQ